MQSSTRVISDCSEVFAMAAINRDHLPFPMPERPHALVQEWRNLTFMHWEVSVEKLQPHIPDGLEIDLFQGKAYVGTIPFVMTLSLIHI